MSIIFESNSQLYNILRIYQICRSLRSHVYCKRYVSENLEIDIGELQSSLFMQFCLEEIGPFVYNQAISDAHDYMQKWALDLENSCYTPESTYWIKLDKKKVRCKSVQKNLKQR